MNQLWGSCKRRTESCALPSGSTSDDRTWRERKQVIKTQFYINNLFSFVIEGLLKKYIHVMFYVIFYKENITELFQLSYFPVT